MSGRIVTQNWPWTAGLVGMALSLGTPIEVRAWEATDRQLYNNKMALLQVIRDGAGQRAAQSGDVETLCLVLSIGVDVTERYVQAKPKDEQIRKRLKGMRKDLLSCLALMQQSR
ncbi:hypothetical protein SynWH8101_1344 [Synechococcus sp. WH 8101]|nr:hypothetical protein SynWH8101_1344 [Synechococcus sp. WH 8101]QNI45160.1 hypothetical protein SynRCC2555_01377 [Synechococcus sp. WH 8101]